MDQDTTTDFVCAVDVGGTFTDSLLMDETGEVTTAKAPSTDDIVCGFFDSIETAAVKLGYDLHDVFDRSVRIAHGTTVATNMVVEDTGAKTGLLTTSGHEDVVRMMKGRGRVAGQPSEKLLEVVGREKPDPIVPRDLVYGIPERIDSEGDVVIDLDENAVRKATQDLVDKGVEAIAISFLWSFRNPDHERRVRQIVKEEAPDVYISCSHDVSPSLGEYERTVATAINAIVGPGTSAYIEQLNADLESKFDFDNSLLLMKCNGGTAPVTQASTNPIMLIGSGPVGGLRASTELVEEVASNNIIATDMGGTSFEVGLIQDGEPIVQAQSVIDSYPYNISKLDIESIGAGGGSVATVNEYSQSLRVGPESAGSNPGPACYQRGGQRPTVTDADLLLGYIDPNTQIGEHITPDRDRAIEAIEPLADDLGLSTKQTARGIYDVVNTKMANLMENKVIGRGYDPRTFSIVSYGGAGPIHAASYSRELGADSVVVPGEVSPVWSAYGVSQSDVRYEFEQQMILLEPFDPQPIQETLNELENRGRELLSESGIDSSRYEPSIAWRKCAMRGRFTTLTSASQRATLMRQQSRQ